jgi:ATP-dependent Lon protease
VRNLEREIASICRKIARRVVTGGEPGLEPRDRARDGRRAARQAEVPPARKNEESEVGVATGLAWTEAGGELLETEVGLMKGKGKLTLTGSSAR